MDLSERKESEKQLPKFGENTKNRKLYEKYLKQMPQIDRDSKDVANEFDSELEWFNSEPLYFESNLKNKLVLIDFWTSWWWDCLHLLPVLERLEHKFEEYKGLAFIGVHSGKFEAESDSYHLRKNILKYDIKHSVVNDLNMQVWTEYEWYYWPTVFIIAPNQKILKVYKELVLPEDLEVFLEAAYDYYDSSLSKNELPITLETEKEITEKENAPKDSFTPERKLAIKSNLRFPHKIIYVSKEECKLYEEDILIIADMGNHRVVIVNEKNGKWIDVIGRGKSGYQDGPFEEARFNQTFGIAYLNNQIYICDSKNHYIRVANLETREVTTLAGTGVRGQDPLIDNENMREQNFTTPFDIVYDKDINSFYIAMSGIHQVWKLDLDTNTIKPFSGNGVEGCHDDQDKLMDCTWAQPSGVSFGAGREGKKELFIADSESSSVRGIDLVDLKSARTVVGGDGSSTNLFSYGDVDGTGIEAKLQHPVGVDYLEPLKKVLILDSYNHRVKLWDPETNEVETILGDGVGGLKDGKGLGAQFMEPTDSCYKYDEEKDEITIYIADSSNDAIRRAVIYSQGSLVKDAQVETVKFRKIPSVVDAVKSKMVECGDGVCKFVRPSKKKKEETT